MVPKKEVMSKERENADEGQPFKPCFFLTVIFIKGLLRICRWPEIEVHDYAS